MTNFERSSFPPRIELSAGGRAAVVVALGGALLAGCNGLPQPETPATGPDCNLYVQVDTSGDKTHPWNDVPIIVAGNPGKGGTVVDYKVAYDAHDPISIGITQKQPVNQGEVKHTFHRKDTGDYKSRDDTWVDGFMVYKPAGSAKTKTYKCGDGKNVQVNLP